MSVNESILQSLAKAILDTYHAGIIGSERLADIARRIEAGTANYAEVYEAAREHGRLLNKSLIAHLPGALTDGRIAEETADVAIKPAIISGAEEVSRVAAEIQCSLNMDAGLGIDFIDPPVNRDQINGIIAGLCESATYESGEAMFLDRVENFLEGHVDDCVRENAKFQYDAGLGPKVERQAMANCCTWCARLQGTYDYASVSDTGNDVFRRHRNCHCQILFNPDSSKRRQNVHSKTWTDEGKADRIAMSKRQDTSMGRQIASPDITNLRNEYVGRSLGARFRNYDIMDLQTGEIYHLAEGEYLRDKEIFAGKGASKPYETAEKYANRYGGAAKDWQHVKGFSVVSTEDGDRGAEIHWSQCEGIGKKEMFIKRWTD